MEEIWKDITGYEGFYQASNLGRIRGLPRTVYNTRGLYIGKVSYINNNYNIMKLSKMNKYGYMSVRLKKNGKGKTLSVHRLIAKTFIPNPSNLPCVNHKDENPSNNCVDNLEWCTRKYNSNYGNCRSKISKALSGRNNAIRYKAVLQYDLDGNFIQEYKSVKEANKKLGINIYNSGIPHCCGGRNKTAFGYVWKYKKTI